MTDSPAAAPLQTPAAWPSASPSSRRFWWLSVGLLAVLAGGGIAHGPESLRRPWLTPLLMGLAVGAAASWLAKATSSPESRLSLLAVAIAAASAVLLLHVEQFRSLRRTVLSQPVPPGRPFLAPGIDDFLERADVSESQRRQYRLATAPTFADYLTQRAELLFGSAAGPVSWLALLGEAGLAAVTAAWGWRWAGANRPNLAAARTDASRSESHS